MTWRNDRRSKKISGEITRNLNLAPDANRESVVEASEAVTLPTRSR
jgi:hypothetical protein